MTNQPKRLYECGPFLLDPENQVLARNGEPIPLPPKAFETLLVLVEQRGALLEKERLLKTVWPDTYVEENNLTQYVSLLRKVLGDNAGEQQYIETVPKRGYRFVAPVREVTNGGDLVLTRHLRARIVVREEEEITTEDADVKTKPQSIGSAISRLGTTKFVLALATVLIAGAAGYLGLSRRHEGRGAVVPNARRSVAVLGFRNLSGKPESDWISTALAEMLSTELAAGERLRTVSGEDVARVKTDLKLPNTETLSKTTLAQIRDHVGADVTISGSFVELEPGPRGQLRLDLSVQDTVAGETVGSISETGTEADLFQLVARAGAKLRAKLGAPEASEIEEAEFRAALPVTPEAEQLYAQGLLRLRAFDAPAAERLLSKAVVADPKYALAHSALAAAWSSMGYDEKAKAEAKKALDLSDNLSRQEHLLITGRYWEMMHDWNKAVDAYQLLVGFAPDNLDYGLRLVGAQVSAGNGRESLNTVAILRRLAPPLNADPQIDLAEAAATESLGDFKQENLNAGVAVNKGEILGENLLVARSLTKQSWALSRLGQPQSALELLERARNLFEAAGDAQGTASSLRGMATIFQSQGDYAQAMQKNQQALAIFERTGDKGGMAKTLNNMAIVPYEQGQLEEARALFEKSLKIQIEVGSKLNTAGALGNIASVLDAEGRLDEAQKLTEESVGVFREVGDQRALGTALGNLAALRYERGDLPGAKRTYEDALRIKREIGYQRGVAYDLAGLGQVLSAEGDLPGARSDEEEALAIRKKIGEEHNLAVSQLDLAQLSLDDGQPAQAETLASQAAAQFEKDRSRDNEALAHILMARSFLAQNKPAEAQAAVTRASTLTRNNPSRILRFELSLVSADEAADKGHSVRSSVIAAEKALESSLTDATKSGYLGYEFRIRLALGGIQLKHGNQTAGRASLKALSSEAQARGFGLITHKAETAFLDEGPR